MSRLSFFSFLTMVALGAVLLSACNSRSRGRVPTRDSATDTSTGSDGGTDSGATDSATDTGPSVDGEVPMDTATPPGACMPSDTITGFGLPLITGTTTTETNDAMGGCGGDGGSMAPEAIFEWRAGMVGTFQIDTNGSNFDTVLYVRSAGAAPCAGPEIACDDDGGSGSGASSLTIDVTDPSAVFYIFVDGYNTNSGDFVLNISPVG